MTRLVPLILLAAALLEAGGDAVVHIGLRGSRPAAAFAGVSVLAGCFVFREHIPASTWLGLGLILAGGTVMQFGPR